MLVKTYGSTLIGVDAIMITVEVSIDQGINWYLVGLPDNAVRESHQRIEAALKHIGYKIPGKKIVINMAPADIRKEGSAYDLTIALAGATDSSLVLTSAGTSAADAIIITASAGGIAITAQDNKTEDITGNSTNTITGNAVDTVTGNNFR